MLYFWHSVGNRALTLLSNCLTNIICRHGNLLQSLPPRSDSVDPIEEKSFCFEPEITVKVARRKLRIYEVGISYWGRNLRRSKKIGWKTAYEPCIAC